METGRAAKKLANGSGGISPTRSRAYRLAVRKAKYAEIMDHFGYTPGQIAELTDLQIHELCFHTRESQGEDAGRIKRPIPPARARTEEEHVAAFLRMARAAKAGKKQTEQTVARIRAMHARKRQEEGCPHASE